MWGVVVGCHRIMHFKADFKLMHAVPPITTQLNSTQHLCITDMCVYRPFMYKYIHFILHIHIARLISQSIII